MPNAVKQRVLVGWKEISTYLGFSVDTARRRHKARPLPVWQEPTGTNARGNRTFGAVQALPEELDRWVIKGKGGGNGS